MKLDVLAQCLTIDSPNHTPILTKFIQLALKKGGRPFEAVAGTPKERYGARLTFETPGGSAALAETFGLSDHPWGLPGWIGLRLDPAGVLRAKGYHERRDCRGFSLPEGAPAGLRPVMASLDQGATELYLRCAAGYSWTAFVERATAGLGVKPESFSPHPRPVEGAFCVSFAWGAGALESVTVFADQRALPDDETIERLWQHGMEEADRRAYQAAYAGVRALGPRGLDSWHAMLGWTIERSGALRRAASLRIPLEL